MLDLINENDKIIVATSGGPDSMYLLTELINEQKTKNLSLLVAHVNHGTRKECDEEEKFVKEFCLKNNIICEIYKINKYQKGHFTEEEARKIRIEFFTTLINKYHYDYVVTAHHADDLIETILMKIIRGSTLDSIVGIKNIQKINNIVFKRPLLSISKDKIINELNKKHIPYKIDYTNYEENHLRNRIRKNIVPLLKEEVNNLNMKFLKFSKELNDLMEYLKYNLDIIDKELRKDDFIDLKKFNNLDYFLKKEYLKYKLKEIYQNNINKLNSKTYDKIINYLNNFKKKNTLLLPLSYIVEVNKNHFRIIKNKTINNYCWECLDKLELKEGILIKKDCFSEKSNYEIHLNSNDLKLPLYITNRKDGMKMKVKNLNGSKKVKDILIDEHVLPSKKDEIPIMIDSNGEVLWILGLKKSKYDLDNYEKCDIIYKYERKELKNEKNK